MEKGVYIKRKMAGISEKTGREIKLDSGEVYRLDGYRDGGRTIVLKGVGKKILFQVTFNKDKFEIVNIR